MAHQALDYQDINLFIIQMGGEGGKMKLSSFFALTNHCYNLLIKINTVKIETKGLSYPKAYLIHQGIHRVISYPYKTASFYGIKEMFELADR